MSQIAMVIRNHFSGGRLPTAGVVLFDNRSRVRVWESQGQQLQQLQQLSL